MLRRPSKISLITVCSSFIILLALNCVVLRVDAESTRIFLNPSSQTVGAVGDSFTVNVSVADVTNLYGYEFKLYYNSSIVNGTSSPIEGPFLKSGGQTFYYVTDFTDNYNSTFGIAWVESDLTGSIPGVNGSGVLATIEFKSLALGNSISLELADVKLSDPNSNPISCQVSDGTVTVLPEFTPLIEMSALVVVSLFTFLLVKKGKSKPSYFNR